MDGDQNLARSYRKRAQEVLNIANTVADLGHREVLKQVAADYEQMARHLDERASADHTAGQHLKSARARQFHSNKGQDN